MSKTAEERAAYAEQKAKKSAARQYFVDLPLESIPGEEAKDIVTVLKNLAATSDRYDMLSNDLMRIFPETMKGENKHPLYEQYQGWIAAYMGALHANPERVIIRMASDSLKSNFSPELAEPLAQALVYCEDATSIEAARARITAEHPQTLLSIPAVAAGSSATPPITPSPLLENNGKGAISEPMQGIRFSHAVTAIQNVFAKENIRIQEGKSGLFISASKKGIEHALTESAGIDPSKKLTPPQNATTRDIEGAINLLNKNNRLNLVPERLASIIERATTAAQRSSVAR